MHMSQLAHVDVTHLQFAMNAKSLSVAKVIFWHGRDILLIACFDMFLQYDHVAVSPSE